MAYLYKSSGMTQSFLSLHSKLHWAACLQSLSNQHWSTHQTIAVLLEKWFPSILKITHCRPQPNDHHAVTLVGMLPASRPVRLPRIGEKTFAVDVFVAFNTWASPQKVSGLSFCSHEAKYGPKKCQACLDCILQFCPISKVGLVVKLMYLSYTCLV